MEVYLDLVIILNFLVDFLLLVGTNRLAGFPLGAGRCALGGALGALYAGMCLVPGFRFLGNGFWRLVFLALMALTAFGVEKSALRRGLLFLLLSMALGGVAEGLGDGSFGALVLGAAVIALLCALGFQGKLGERYITVELYHQDRRCTVRALVDTGNTLKDHLTGQSVLVAGERAAKLLLDLDAARLADPIGTIQVIPGLRLIPYRAVGQSGGMLLAAKMEAKIGKKRESCLVAFAPQEIGNGTEYEALIGGMV